MKGTMLESGYSSRAEVRRAVRALPRERRRGLIRAVREGRAVDDARDAALAVAWAQRLQAAYWPGWALPRSRPKGRRAVLWLVHSAWMIAVLGIVFVGIWLGLRGLLRWLVVGVVAYAVVSIPWVFVPLFRTYRNAPEAERRNRELLGQETVVAEKARATHDG